MANPPSSSDAEHPPEGGNGEHEQREGYEAFFRIWPIAFFKHHARQYGRQNSAKGQRDYLGGLSRDLWRLIAGCKPIWTAGIVLLALAGGRFVFESSKSDSQVTMAFFTAAIFFLGIIQWWTTRQQLEQARRDFRQAQESLNISKEQQRGRLALIRVDKPAVRIGEHWTCTYDLENIGPTELTTMDVVGGVFFVPAVNGEPSEPFDESKMHSLIHITLRGTQIIPADAPISYELWCPSGTIVEHLEDFEQRKCAMYVVARFCHRDIFLKRHWLEISYTYYKKSPSFYRWAGGYQTRWSE